MGKNRNKQQRAAAAKQQATQQSPEPAAIADPPFDDQLNDLDGQTGGDDPPPKSPVTTGEIPPAQLLKPINADELVRRSTMIGVGVLTAILGFVVGLVLMASTNWHKTPSTSFAKSSHQTKMTQLTYEQDQLDYVAERTRLREHADNLAKLNEADAALKRGFEYPTMKPIVTPVQKTEPVTTVKLTVEPKPAVTPPPTPPTAPEPPKAPEAVAPATVAAPDPPIQDMPVDKPPFVEAVDAPKPQDSTPLDPPTTSELVPQTPGAVAKAPPSASKRPTSRRRR